MKHIDWEGYAFFGCLVVIPAIIVGVSSFYLFPDMRWMSTGLLLVTVIIGFLVHRRTSEPVAWLRQVGIVLAAVLGITMGCNLISHVGYTRDLSASNASRTQHLEDETRELAALQTKTQLQKELTEAETKRMGELRRVLIQTPFKQRESLLSKLAVGTPTTAPTAQPSKPDEPKIPTTPPLTPDQVREEWQPLLLKLLILDVAVSLLCGIVAAYYRQWDGNGNGIPEWIEQVARTMTREQFAGHYQSEFNAYGNALTFADPKA